MTKFYARSLAFVRQALTWWLHELAGMVPSRLKQKLVFARGRVVLVQQDGGYAVLHCTGAAEKPLGQLAAGAPLSPASLTAAIGDARLARRTLGGKLPLVLRLPSNQALVTRLTLPATVKADLPQILRFEMDRRTPFSAEDAFFSYAILPGSPAGKLHVVMTVIAKAAMAEILTRLTPLGIAVRQVTVAGAPGLPVSGNLLPAEGAGNGRQLLIMRFAAAAMMLLVAGGLYSIWRDSEDAVAALRRDMADLRKTIEHVEATRSEIERLGAASDFLNERRRNSPTVTHMLADLTRVLPDDTWLTHLSMQDDKLQIAGYSAAAAGLIEKALQSPAFHAAQFRSAVTQDTAMGRERFEMVMTISADQRP